MLLCPPQMPGQPQTRGSLSSVRHVPLNLLLLGCFSLPCAAQDHSPAQNHHDEPLTAEIEAVGEEVRGAVSDVFEPEERLTTQEVEREIGRVKDEDGNWIDASHHYIGSKADDLAIYLDRFFGAPIEDLESADSTVRLLTRFDYDQDDGSDIRIRLRGNVHLPRINERISLVFNGEDEDDRNTYNDDESENTAGFQIRAADTRRSRFDLTIGVSSGPNLKPGVRYRFKDNLGDSGRVRYTGRADYSDSRRFRMVHNVELDWLTGETSLIRWANRAEFGQRTEGTEWNTAVSWRLGYSVDSAFAWVIGASGKTEPDIPDAIIDGEPYEGRTFMPPYENGGSLVTNVGTRLKFRNRAYKDWLYVEFEPGYTFRKRNHFEDRHGVFFARVNFEITFNRGREQTQVQADDSMTDPEQPPVASNGPAP